MIPMMKRAAIVLIACGLFLASSAEALSPARPAVRPLIPADGFDPSKSVAAGARYIPDGAAVERFLAAMDGAPPDWEKLAGPHGVGDEEALEKLNVQRDSFRKTRRLASQPIAFRWTGRLIAYDEDRGGFTIGIGPERFETTWGEVFIRPEDLPLYLIAVPAEADREPLRARLAAGDLPVIRILMEGRLSSIVYGFSHEHRGKGAVIPRVWLQEIQFFLEPEPSPEDRPAGKPSD